MRNTIKQQYKRHISRKLREYKGIENIFGMLEADDKYNLIVHNEYFPVSIEIMTSKNLDYNKNYDGSIFFLLKWGVSLISYFNNEINRFLKLKNKYENMLFKQNYLEAANILMEIQNSLGYSTWGYFQKLLILNLSKSNKTLEDSVKGDREYIRSSLKKTFFYTLFAYYEKLADKNLSLYDYSGKIEELLKNETNIVERKYLNYKLNIKELKQIQDFKIALTIDEQLSIIDYYETYIDVIQNLYLDSNIRNHIKDAVYSLDTLIDDFRLYNLRIALGGNIDRERLNEKINYFVEQYTVGNYDIFNNQYLQYLDEEISNFEFYNLFLKSRAKSLALEGDYSNLWNSISCIYSLNYVYENTLKELEVFLKRLYYSSWRYKIYGILSRKLGYNSAVDKALCLSVINDKIITPLFYQCIIENEKKKEFLNLLSSVAYCTSNLHLYVIGSLDENQLNSEIEAVRFQYYKIIKLDKENKSFECINECMKILQNIGNNNELYMQERVLRILYSNYLKLDMFIEAIHLYVESYIVKRELVLRMPLHSLILFVSKNLELYESLKSDICKPIILKLFYKKDHEEVVSAYLDYLEAKDSETILDFLNKKSSLDKYEVFFLDEVCTESLLRRDYVSLSKIKGRAVDLRICLLKFLIKSNEGNQKKYFVELESLIKEIQLQERIELFNHNRIFIDKEKLLDYLKDSINQLHLEDATVGKIKEFFEDSGQSDARQVNKITDNILEKIKQAYLYESPYSLETFLSTRIRHVFCKDNLKKIFEEYKLFSKKEMDDSETYLINDYWKEKLNDSDYNKVIVAMSKFSKKINCKIQEIKDEWIRIRKNKNDKEMFDYCDFIENFKSTVMFDLTRQLNSEEEFYKKVIEQLDFRTEEILGTIRDRLEKEIKPYYKKALDEFEIDIKRLDFDKNAKGELLRNIQTSKAKYVNDINEFKNIFHMENKRCPDFLLEDVVNFCCKIECDINKDFNSVNIKLDMDDKSIYKGEIFPYMVDIMSILMHNVVEHSKLAMSSINLEISIAPFKRSELIHCTKKEFHNKYRDYVVLHFRNNLDTNIDIEGMNGKIKHIIENMNENTFREMSKVEGGSGLYKIAKTISYNLDTLAAFCHVPEDKHCNINVIVDLRKHLKE